MEVSDDWIARLRGEAAERDAALERLRAVLVRGLSRSLARSGGGESFAEDIAQQSLVRILDQLDGFDGRSKFTTWAMAIAVRLAISELRRRHFQDVSLDAITRDDQRPHQLAVDRQPTAEQQAMRRAILQKLYELIDDSLSDRQRKVIQASLAGMPVEEIAARMDSNRNAIYKLLHDARRKLRDGFEAAEIRAGDIESALSARS